MTRNIFYPAIIAFSLIVIVSVRLVDISNGAGMFLLVLLFNVISISAVIKVLLDLKRNGTMINRENITAILDQL
ncbi:MAG: hypothetical protein IPH94_15885 [Saprospiraceae bacterium]|nr:hypothetical protein [Saprospiraceae bacterium]